MHGLLLIDKPEGITSNEVVRIVKRLVRPSKVGHTGTLDPAASGLVVILIGAGTRTLDFLDEARKKYELVVRLGEETDTDDRDGQVVRTGDPSGITTPHIEEALAHYRGVIDQIPPHYSAIKKNGVRLYKLARKGVMTEMPPRKVEIFSLTLSGWDPPFLALDMLCSKGTYARALARDIGRDLGVGGRLEGLRRTASGPYDVADAVHISDLSTGGVEIVLENLIPIATALDHIPDLSAFPAEVRRLMRGTPVNIPRSRIPPVENSVAAATRLFKIVSGEGDLVILVRSEPRGSDISIRPARVFKTWEDR
jgi:tRNA pseudouridine55 synthase